MLSGSWSIRVGEVRKAVVTKSRISVAGDVVSAIEWKSLHVHIVAGKLCRQWSTMEVVRNPCDSTVVVLDSLTIECVSSGIDFFGTEPETIPPDRMSEKRCAASVAVSRIFGVERIVRGVSSSKREAIRISVRSQMTHISIAFAIVECFA